MLQEKFTKLLIPKAITHCIRKSCVIPFYIALACEKILWIKGRGLRLFSTFPFNNENEWSSGCSQYNLDCFVLTQGHQLLLLVLLELLLTATLSLQLLLRCYYYYYYCCCYHYYHSWTPSSPPSVYKGIPIKRMRLVK